MDHDQRFKELIKAFFAEFLQLFFAVWAARFDTETVVWLDKEMFPDPPEGVRRTLDLVAQLPTRMPVKGAVPGQAETWLALVHIEIESPDRVKPLRSRMHRSYVYLRDQYGLPVLPIAIYLKVGLNGVGIDIYEETFWEFCPIRFQYLYVGLPALNALEYVQKDNWLGVALASLMRVPKEKAAWLGAEALRRIMEAPLSDQKRFLLGECVQAYLPLDEAQQQEFDKLLAGEAYRGIRDMNTTWYEKGIEQGVQRGIEQGVQRGRSQERLEIAKGLLEERFGPLSAGVVANLQTRTPEQLADLIKRILKVTNLRELGFDS
jgi:hypothetical protein